MKRVVQRLDELAPRFFPALSWAVAAGACFTFAAVVSVPGDHRGAEGVAIASMLLAIAGATYTNLVVLAPVVLGQLYRERATAEAHPSARLDPRPVDPAFSRYFSTKVLELLAERGAHALQPARREISVLFADLNGFTRYSEISTAEDSVATLTHYLDELVRVAHVHDGTIDKFMGDEIMVLFGAPLDQADHAVRAIACARDMQVVVGLLNVERSRRNLPTLGLTVGLNSGECVVGNVGGETRVQYSAIGDVVNVAKRIQGLATRGDIVVGERTLELASLPTPDLEEHYVKGRGKPVRMRRIGSPEAPTPFE